MASHGASSSSTSFKNSTNSGSETSSRIKRLYQCVDEDDTPLPRQWNSGSKANFISLTQNNLRVYYKGDHCIYIITLSIGISIGIDSTQSISRTP